MLTSTRAWKGTWVNEARENSPAKCGEWGGSISSVWISTRIACKISPVPAERRRGMLRNAKVLTRAGSCPKLGQLEAAAARPKFGPRPADRPLHRCLTVRQRYQCDKLSHRWGSLKRPHPRVKGGHVSLPPLRASQIAKGRMGGGSFLERQRKPVVFPLSSTFRRPELQLAGFPAKQKRKAPGGCRRRERKKL